MTGPQPSEKEGILPLVLENVMFGDNGRRLLDDISLSLEAGPLSVILGANGAGKSLLLRLCHGLIAPTAGSLSWRGPLGPEASRHQAMVFQRPVMLRRSVRANLAYALKARHVPRRRRPGDIEAALAEARLAHVAGQPALSLSGGEQQRLALARAWVVHSQVVFLDEPTANLDPAGTKIFETFVRAMHRAGTKIVMTTHDIAQARRLADEIIFLSDGRVIESSAAADFFEAPKTAEAEAYVRGILP